MEETQGCDREMTLEERCRYSRAYLKDIEKHFRELMGSEIFNSTEKFSGQHSEMKAQIMLTVRHIEDARMRIGKILQYADDGVSILDK